MKFVWCSCTSIKAGLVDCGSNNNSCNNVPLALTEEVERWIER